MAQTGFTPILLYSSSTASAAPVAGNLTNSTLGSELAININDGKLFYKDSSGVVQVIGWKVVPATAGGTGITAYTTGDLLYANTATTLARLADVATGNALISGGVGVAPSWGKIDLTTTVSGTLPTANGGTNLTSFTANGLLYASSTSALATSSNLTYNTDFSLTGGNLLTLKTSGAPVIQLQSSQGAGSVQPTFQAYRIGASSTATPNSQNIGTIRFDGLDTTPAFCNFGLINLEIGTNAAGGALSNLTFHVAVSGANATEQVRLTPTGMGIGTSTIYNKLDLNGSLGRNAPVTKTGDFTLGATENWVINNKSGSSCTVTLPAASSWTGREVMFKNTQAQTLVSASSNVVPRAGGSAGTAILAATAGAWATLVSDGSNWVIMAGS